MRPITATIHRAALQHNLRRVRDYAPHARAMAVVKANGYGHGLLNVARGLAEADGFAVLRLQEALELRAAGYQQTLLLLEGVFESAELNAAADAGVSIVVHAEHQIAMLEQASLPVPIAVFVKMNTGMNRLGFVPQAFASAVARLAACSQVSSITLMTHFATADEAPGIATALQRFEAGAAGMQYPKSLANSAAILRHPESHADWVRPGIMLYGATPVQSVPAAHFGLQAVMHLQSELIAVQTLPSGESLGYGATFVAERETRVGIVACGYADGYPRHAPGGTPIAVAGQVSKTLGRVSMDMLFVDITDIPAADIGSPVELWGATIPVDAVAEACGTVGYELLCAVTSRVNFKVVHG
jgi:alanine racemase